MFPAHILDPPPKTWYVPGFAGSYNTVRKIYDDDYNIFAIQLTMCVRTFF